MRQVIALLALAPCVAGCGAKNQLLVPEPTPVDAGMDAGIDAAFEEDAGVFVCPTEPCDCLAEGAIEWEEVEVCPTWASPGVRTCGLDFDGFGREVRIEASCPGAYTFCGRIETPDGCLIAERCEVARVRAVGARARVQIPSIPDRYGGCAARGALEDGVRVCARVEWSAAGHTGSEDFGCFAWFGPWCFADCGPPGPPGAGGGTDGSWTFGD
jgi:hypothetical protein